MQEIYVLYKATNVFAILTKLCFNGTVLLVHS